MKTTLTKVFTCTAVALALTLSGLSQAQVTFTKDVLPIFQENCQTCHRPSGANLSGMIAPMSLMSFKEARPWAKAIAKAVESKIMPPWDATEHPDLQQPEAGQLHGDRE